MRLCTSTRQRRGVATLLLGILLFGLFSPASRASADSTYGDKEVDKVQWALARVVKTGKTTITLDFFPGAENQTADSRLFDETVELRAYAETEISNDSRSLRAFKAGDLVRVDAHVDSYIHRYRVCRKYNKARTCHHKEETRYRNWLDGVVSADGRCVHSQTISVKVSWGKDSKTRVQVCASRDGSAAFVYLENFDRIDGISAELLVTPPGGSSRTVLPALTRGAVSYLDTSVPLVAGTTFQGTLTFDVVDDGKAPRTVTLRSFSL
jgi:hypothetical protein